MGNCCDYQSRKQNIPNPLIVPTDDENKELSLRFKEEGNQFMQQQLFKEAIAAYTEAIKIYSKESIYYSNRAVAYRTQKQYDNVKRDAYTALELDNKNVRAYYILGTVLLITAQRDKHYVSAVDGMNFLILADKYKEQKPQLIDAIQKNLQNGKILQEQLEKYSKYQEFLNFKEQMKQRYGNLINIDKLTFQGIRTPYIPTSIECYNCIITQDFMQEPTLLSSGHTYEKCAIMECTRQNGPQDPTTRENISHITINNTQIKDAILDYLKNSLEFY